MPRCSVASRSALGWQAGEFRRSVTSRAGPGSRGAHPCSSLHPAASRKHPGRSTRAEATRGRPMASRERQGRPIRAKARSRRRCSNLTRPRVAPGRQRPLRPRSVARPAARRPARGWAKRRHARSMHRARPDARPPAPSTHRARPDARAPAPSTPRARPDARAPARSIRRARLDARAPGLVRMAFRAASAPCRGMGARSVRSRRSRRARMIPRWPRAARAAASRHHPPCPQRPPIGRRHAPRRLESGLLRRWRAGARSARPMMAWPDRSDSRVMASPDWLGQPAIRPRRLPSRQRPRARRPALPCDRCLTDHRRPMPAMSPRPAASQSARRPAPAWPRSARCPAKVQPRSDRHPLPSHPAVGRAPSRRRTAAARARARHRGCRRGRSVAVLRCLAAGRAAGAVSRGGRCARGFAAATPGSARPSPLRRARGGAFARASRNNSRS